MGGLQEDLTGALKTLDTKTEDLDQEDEKLANELLVN